MQSWEDQTTQEHLAPLTWCGHREPVSSKDGHRSPQANTGQEEHMHKGRITVTNGPKITEHAHTVCVRRGEECVVWYSTGRGTPCRTSLTSEELADTRLCGRISQALYDFITSPNTDQREAGVLMDWLKEQHEKAFLREAQTRTRRRIEDRLRKDPQFVEAVAYLMGLTS